jgi:hypothetical protein
MKQEYIIYINGEDTIFNNYKKAILFARMEIKKHGLEKVNLSHKEPIKAGTFTIEILNKNTSSIINYIITKKEVKLFSLKYSCDTLSINNHNKISDILSFKNDTNSLHSRN